MKRFLKLAALAVLMLFAAIQFVRPPRTNPPSDPQAALGAHVAVPVDVAAVFDRSCRDCHSNDTQWPWYSQVAPVSWFVIDHVNHGRSHFNYSEWTKYDRAERAKLIEGSCEIVQKGAMPLESYLWMHRGARVSTAETAALCQWARATLVAMH